jgi:hypothetical protein
MRTTTIVATTVALAAGTLLAAAPAHARPAEYEVVVPAQAWVQSFERSGPDAPCVPPKELDIPWQADWPAAEQAWIPTWEQWPNGGTGGWTCLRIITWAPAQYAPVLV